MALYYFDVNECGHVTIDKDGHDCADEADMLAHAVSVARGIMAAEVMIGKLCLTCCVEIYDADRNPVQKMPFTYAIDVTGVSPSQPAPQRQDPSG